jgi:hypothetical protein
MKSLAKNVSDYSGRLPFLDAYCIPDVISPTTWWILPSSLASVSTKITLWYHGLGMSGSGMAIL